MHRPGHLQRLLWIVAGTDHNEELLEQLQILRARPLVSTFSCFQQVTAKEIRQLNGPIKPLPMEILQIDICSGLVVGMNGYAHARMILNEGGPCPCFSLYNPWKRHECFGLGILDGGEGLRLWFTQCCSDIKNQRM